MNWTRRSGKLPQAISAVWDSEDRRFSVLVTRPDGIVPEEFILQMLEDPLVDGEFRTKTFPTMDLAKAFAEEQ